MTEFNEGRRAALKLGGGVGLFGLLGGSGVKASAPALPAFVGSSDAQGPVAVARGVFGSSKWAAQRAMDVVDRRAGRRHFLGGFDPAIACLRSVSPAMKCVLQEAKDVRHFSLVERLREVAWK